MQRAPGALALTPAGAVSAGHRGRACELGHEMRLPSAQVERYAEGMRRFDFDAGLAPYQLDTYSLWQRLTPHVTAAAISRIAPAQVIADDL